MYDDVYDDAPRGWYWAAKVDGLAEGYTNAGENFVVACGQREFQRELWCRVRREFKIEHPASPAWNGFGPPDGRATLADCMYVFLSAREIYGASYNKTTIELAQVPAWARFLRTAPSGRYDIGFETNGLEEKQCGCCHFQAERTASGAPVPNRR